MKEKRHWQLERPFFREGGGAGMMEGVNSLRKIICIAAHFILLFLVSSLCWLLWGVIGSASLTEQRAFVVHQRPLQPIQIPRAPGGGGGRGGVACVPSSTNNSNNTIGSICSITGIFSRETFFSIYISADSDVNTDLVISKAWEPTWCFWRSGKWV